ncbi:MAG: PadR family transcriptional regulator [Chloroflexi bacterium]|nr:PadR family transcriptional regulator [Chloroflexota bacterium]
MPQDFHDLGRLAEPAITVLVSLSDGPKHGYVIMADAELIAGEPIGPGTLYAVLARLEHRGLIKALEPEDRRRPYRLTASGAAALEAHLAAMAVLVRTGQTRLEAHR